MKITNFLDLLVTAGWACHIYHEGADDVIYIYFMDKLSRVWRHAARTRRRLRERG